MITVVLRGGLGNQMFEYAAGLSLARTKATSLSLDTVFLNDRFPRQNFTYRTYDLDIFELASRFTLLSKISGIFPIPGVWLCIDLALAKLRDIFKKQQFIKEASGNLSFNKDVFLWGFWQSPKYFEGVEHEIRNSFRFRSAPSGKAAHLLAKIKETNSISLHVRRGDYLKSKAVYGETQIAYYQSAVEYMLIHVKDPIFFVFSDDIAWCRKNIKAPFPVEYIEKDSEGPKASWHLQLMASCKHNIIANSTFSWWGAWLNQNPAKIVIAPKHWNASVASEEVVLSGWIKL